MLISHRWLSELLADAIDPDVVSHQLTRLGLEVEDIKTLTAPHKKVVIGKVIELGEVKSGLWFAKVSVGTEVVQILTRLDPTNFHKDARIAVALPGARLVSGTTVEARTMDQVQSQGVFVSEHDIGIGFESKTLLQFPSEHGDVEPGQIGSALSNTFRLSDIVFTVNVTPNRSDCFSHRGIAREVLVGLGQDPAHLSLYAEVKRLMAWAEQLPNNFEVSIDGSLAHDRACELYEAFVIDNIREENSSLVSRHRLFALGVRAISASVDITNLMMLEWGQPMHAFDADQLWKEKPEVIRIRAAHDREQLRTLDGEVRTLESRDVVIANAHEAVALAGVMGGETSELRKNSRRLVLESACFHPRWVRRTSKRLGLHTEASHRYERGIDAAQTQWLGALAAERVAAISHGTVVGRARAHIQRAETKPVKLRFASTEKLLGIGVSTDTQKDILQRLGFEISQADATSCAVTAPTWRHDISREADLIEEVARVWGYDRIPSTLPHIVAAQDEQRSVHLRRTIQQAAVACGLTESINHSAYSEASARRVAPVEKAVRFINPLSHERVYLRTSLLQGLIENCQRAFRYQSPRAAHFEIGNVFSKDTKSQLPVEKLKLAVILSGESWHWMGKAVDFDFFDLKGTMVHVLSAVGLRQLAWYAMTNSSVSDAATIDSIWHPGKTADVISQGVYLGRLGELHPDFLDAYDVERSVLFAEIDFEKILTIQTQLPESKAQPPATTPRISRDLALTVANEVTAQQIVDQAWKAATLLGDTGKLLKDINVFDVYTGPPVPQGYKSIAFRMTFWDEGSTLTEVQVVPVERNVLEGLHKAFAATQR